MDKKKKPSSKSGSKPSSAARPSSKKKGKNKKKTKKITETFISKYPPINYDLKSLIPEVSIDIKMEIGKSSLSAKVPITTSFNKLIKMIQAHHFNACHKVRIYDIINSERKYLDDYRYYTLDDYQGIKLNQTNLLFYEFEPICHPMLEAGLV